MITLISKLFILFAYLAQILGIVLIGVGIFVPELRFYLISRAVVLMILGGFGFYFHDTLDDWLEGKRHKKWKAKQAKLEASVQTELKKPEPSRGSVLLLGLVLALLFVWGIAIVFGLIEPSP